MQCVKRLIDILLLVAMPAIGLAQNENSKQPIHIESNSASYDDNTGESVYIGDVVVIQANMRMNADRMVVSMIDKKTDKIIATGNPVTFLQTSPDQKGEIRGKAMRAEYHVVTSTLILLEKAQVWQGENVYCSERIEYDSENAVVKAGEKNSGSKRVHVTLHQEGVKANGNTGCD